MQQNNQNVKIPFNNQDGLGYTVNAQCINKECPGSDKISWFSANLNSNLSIPASVDVAIFINVRANYTNQNIDAFRDHVKSKIDEVDRHDGWDEKFKTIS